MANDKLNSIIDVLNSGEFENGKNQLIELLKEDPQNPEILYNLGMVYSELNEMPSAIEALKKCVAYDPNNSNTYVALGVAQIRQKESSAAKKSFEKALEIAPDNPYVHRNLGTILGHSNDHDGAIFHLEKSLEAIPDDVLTLYGLGTAYLNKGDKEKALRLFQRIKELPATPHFHQLAEDQITKIKKESGGNKPREKAIEYCYRALKYFDRIELHAMKKIVYEIAALGASGIDIESEEKKYTIQTLEGDFAGLELVSYLYVGLRKFSPGQDAGIDLEFEYQEALKRYNQDG